MKPCLRIIPLAVALCAGLFATNASDQHGHAHKATPGGGRLLEKTEPHAEFVVEKDRGVTIHFYDHDLKPVAATTQTVTVIASGKDGRWTLEFERKGDSLASKTKLPEVEGCNVVVQFRQTAGTKPSNHRFKLDLNHCGGCKRAEYACVCDH